MKSPSLQQSFLFFLFVTTSVTAFEQLPLELFGLIVIPLAQSTCNNSFLNLVATNKNISNKVTVLVQEVMQSPTKTPTETHKEFLYEVFMQIPQIITSALEGLPESLILNKDMINKRIACKALDTKQVKVQKALSKKSPELFETYHMEHDSYPKSDLPIVQALMNYGFIINNIKHSGWYPSRLPILHALVKLNADPAIVEIVLKRRHNPSYEHNEPTSINGQFHMSPQPLDFCNSDEKKEIYQKLFQQYARSPKNTTDQIYLEQETL